MKPNILILTIDSLRADRCYSDTKTCKTPNIDKLIENGIYCSQAISTSDSTGTSLGSLFFGLYPFNSGISHFSYNDNHQSIFDILESFGYFRAGTFPDVSFFLNITKKFELQNSYIYDKRENWKQLSGGIGEQILGVLETLHNHQPWIYFIHLMDLHAPFYLPTEYDKKIFGETRYDRMISYIDEWIGKFINSIDFQNTTLILTSDHGDYIPIISKSTNPNSFSRQILRKGKNLLPYSDYVISKILSRYQLTQKQLQKKVFENKLTDIELRTLGVRGTDNLFDELIRIPLIFFGNKIKHPKIISTQVKQIDIMPTIFELNNFDNSLLKIDGKSIVPLLCGENYYETLAYIESGTRDPKKLGKIIGIRTPEYKYYRSRDDVSSNVHLYDLKNDPNELNNISQNLSLIDNMEKQLQNLIENKEQKIPKIDDEKSIEEELKKLGYI